MVQAHAASAVLNFSENCTPEILTPYLDGVISKLLVLLQVYFIHASKIDAFLCLDEIPRTELLAFPWSQINASCWK